MAVGLKEASLDNCCKKEACRNILFCLDDPCVISGQEYDPSSCSCLNKCGGSGSAEGGDEGYVDVYTYKGIPPGSMLAVSFNSFTVEDSLSVFGGASYSTGCVGTEGFLNASLPLKAGDGDFKITVRACESGTAWVLNWSIVCG